MYICRFMYLHLYCDRLSTSILKERLDLFGSTSLIVSIVEDPCKKPEKGPDS